MLAALTTFTFTRIPSPIMTDHKLDGLEQYIQTRARYFIDILEHQSTVLSEDNHLGSMEALYVTSNPIMKSILVEGKQVSIDDCVSEDEVEW